MEKSSQSDKGLHGCNFIDNFMNSSQFTMLVFQQLI